jgi:hypothetical protein
VRQEVPAHEIAKRPTTFIKEDTWRVVKIQEKSPKVVGRRSSWIVIIGSRGIWTIDLSRGRFWNFRVCEFEGPRIVCSWNHKITNYKISKSGPWSWVDFCISGFGSSKDLESL